MKSSNKSWKTRLSGMLPFIVGGATGLYIAKFHNNELRELSTVSVSAAAAWALTAILAIVCVLAIVMVCTPKLSILLSLHADEEEWAEERQKAWASLVGILAIVPILPVMMLFPSVDWLTPSVSIGVIVLCGIVATVASLASWAAMDELERDLTIATGNLSFYGLLATGGIWSIFAHFSVVSPMTPMDWITLFLAVALTAAVVAYWRRGLLEEVQ